MLRCMSFVAILDLIMQTSKKSEIDWSTINIQLDVDVKTNAHITFLIVRQVKVDDEWLVRRENVDVASRFLYRQYVIFFDF
jgi:hypothetical protein